MAEVDGATLVARNLKKQGVRFMFGIVGFPVQPIAEHEPDALLFEVPREDRKSTRLNSSH